jgi:NAD(P)-dependent dehydrogenase (short-subunit alcohol dehydrogenase family)
MTRKSVVLVTGAGGEMGHGLVTRLAELGTFDILTLDIRPLDPDVSRHCAATPVGDTLDRHLLNRIRSEFERDSPVARSFVDFRASGSSA